MRFQKTCKFHPDVLKLSNEDIHCDQERAAIKQAAFKRSIKAIKGSK